MKIEDKLICGYVDVWMKSRFHLDILYKILNNHVDLGNS